MLGLTSLGAVHTAISLVAVFSGLISLVRSGQISPLTTIGKVYLWSTILTCITAFGIFQHGGFGKAHWLSVLTLTTIAVAAVAVYSNIFGSASRYIVTLGYSLTFFFHLIPAATETFTRLPAGSPVFSSPEDPSLQKLIGALGVLLVLGWAYQIWKLRSKPEDLSNPELRPYR